MKISVEHRPSYALGTVDLAAGEAVQAETDAMVSMSANLQVESGLQGGLLKSAMRKVLGGDADTRVPDADFQRSVGRLLRRDRDRLDQPHP